MAQTVVEFSGDEAKMWRSVQKLITQQDKLKEELRQVKNEAKDAEKKFENSFGMKAANSVASFAKSFISVSTAIAAVTNALREQQKVREQSLTSFRALAEPDRSLAQIATGKEDLEALHTRADTLSSRFGLSREESRRLLFSARSEGFESAVDFIASNVSVVAPEAAATVAGQVPALFKGKITPQQAIAGTLAAATASRLTFEQLGSTLPQAAEGGSVAGATPEETMAVLSVLASRFKSGETAADRMKAIGIKMGLDDRFKGKGFIEGIKGVQKLSETDRDKFLGDSAELNTAYVIMSEELAEIEKRQKLVKEQIDATGTPQSMLTVKRQAADATGGARQRVSASEASLEIERERQFAQKQADFDTTVNQTLADLEATGLNPWERFNAYTTIGIHRLFRPNISPKALRENIIDDTVMYPSAKRKLEAIQEERDRTGLEAANAIKQAANTLNQAADNLGRIGQSDFGPGAQREASMHSVTAE